MGVSLISFNTDSDSSQRFANENLQNSQKISDMIIESSMSPELVICKYGVGIFAAIIPGEISETIVNIILGTQKYIEINSHKYTGINPTDLKMRIGLAISRHNNDKHPAILLDRAEKLLTCAIESDSSEVVCEIIM